MRLSLPKKTTNNFLISLMITSFAYSVPSVAQDNSTVASQRSDDSAADAFLARKQREQQRREAILGRKSANAETGQLKALYRAAAISPPKARGGLSAEKLAMLAESLEIDSVQLLQSLALTPGKVRQMVKSGANPLLAASNFIRGEASLQEQALLADITIVARISAVKDENIGDGYRSTIVLQPIEVFSGSAPKEDVALRQMSGPDSDGSRIENSTDIKAKVGDTFLLMLSSAMYEQVAEERGVKPNKAMTTYVIFGSSYRVDGDTLTAIDLGSPTSVTLSQLRSDLSGVKNAKAAMSAN